MTTDKHKILGFYLGNGNFTDIKWIKPFDKYKKNVQFIKSRKLSFFGKAKLLNINSFSKFIYIGAVLDTPKQTLKDIEYVAFDYIRSGKTEHINRQTIMQTKQNGGLGLTKLDIKIDALHVMHIKNLLFGPPNKWRHFAIYWI